MIHVQNYVFPMLLKTNVNVFNLMSRTNETRYLEWHEPCKCKCWLDANFCNNKQSLTEWKQGWMKTNADVNAKNSLTKVYAIKESE